MNTEQSNPLKPIAIVAVLTLVLDLYKIIDSHHVSWLVATRGAFLGMFLILYILRSHFAWLVVLLLIICVTPIYFLMLYFLSPLQVPAFGVLSIIAAILVGGLVYVISVREQYYSYLRARGRT